MVGEIPAAMLTYFLLKTVGRRTAVSVMSTVTATSLLVSTFVPTHYTILIRVCFSIGMMAASSSLAIVYVFTAEIWPTAQRNTLMNICSMIGRIGSMVAPLAVLLVSLVVAKFCNKFKHFGPKKFEWRRHQMMSGVTNFE